MRTQGELLDICRAKLAEDLSEVATTALVRSEDSPMPPQNALRRARDLTAKYDIQLNPMRAPTPQEMFSGNSYTKSLLLGLLAGGATGALTAPITRANILKSILVGAAAGGAGGLLRRYDIASDPPGLSPVYTIPAGARLGALTGLFAGPMASHALGAGVGAGLITGVAAGGIGGVLNSNMFG